jgi:hypothetical protein
MDSMKTLLGKDFTDLGRYQMKVALIFVDKFREIIGDRKNK